VWLKIQEIPAGPSSKDNSGARRAEIGVKGDASLQQCEKAWKKRENRPETGRKQGGNERERAGEQPENKAI
jgi:hypothetical protein